jgi:hypothetical protein
MTTPAQVHTIQYVALKISPLDVEGVIRREYHDLPQLWRVPLGFLAADTGNARCENNCGAKIGYTFTGAGQLTWRTAYLAKFDDHAIIRLCERCAPTCPSTGAPITGWLPAGEHHA